MYNSLWEAGITLPSFPPLTQDTRTDVLIIGGGLAGILCAHFLTQAGRECLVCEGDHIGCGTTGRTTAVLSAQHDTFYQDLIKRFGADKAKGYLQANLAALNTYRSMASTIDCDFEERPSFIFSTTDLTTLQRESDALSSLGFSAILSNESSLPFSITGAVGFPAQAQFHPLKFLSSLAQNLNIREHTRIIRVEGNTAYTAQHKITAKNIIVTSHFPLINTHGLFFAKLYQKRSYVIAIEGAPDLGATFADSAENGMYFRNYKNLLLIGGGDHRTGKQGGGFGVLRGFAKKYYPKAKERYFWAAQDCMSLDGVPYIGQYSPNLPHVYVASGFNEWGMTSSMAAAQILCDTLTGKSNPHAAVFSPSRSILRPQLFSNIAVSAIDILTPLPKRCPHLGCVLKWNRSERTWDCPCHGSRFTSNGKLLEGPATGNLK